MININTLKQRAAAKERVKIAPKDIAGDKSPVERRREVTAVARRVIAEHRDVLIALKDR